MRKFTSAIAYRPVLKSRIAWLSMCVLFLFCGQMAKAQVATLYTFGQSNGTYTEITGGTVLGATGSDDQVFNNNTTGETGTITNTGFPIGFSFVYDGIAYDKFAVNYNGWIKLGTGTFGIENTSTPLSSGTGVISNVISGAGIDMQGQDGSELSYALVGSAPNRKLVVQWKNAKRYTTGTATSSINFQIVLNETTNVVEIIYGTMATSSTAATAWVAEVGIKGPNNTFATNINNRTTTTNWNTSTVGTTNASKMSFNTTVTFPVPGLTFKWTPPAPCAATPVAGTTSTTLARTVCSGTVPGVITVAGSTSLSISGITYQWQESLNGGTDWASVTGGTGATTASYTPPAFAGAPIQYRLKVTCANGGDAVYSDITSITAVAAPTTQATALTVTAANTSLNAFTTTWTAGNGGRRMVVVSTTPITDPVNVSGQPALTTATVYAGTGQQVVFDGTGTSVTVTGLACGTQYYVKVFDYNRCGSGPYDYYYNVTSGTNGLTVTTLSPSTLPLAVTNNFTGYTGANLSTAVPGWYEATIATAAGSAPSSTNPQNLIDTSTGWRQSTAFGITTAKVNLFSSVTNAWIISPKMAITANSRLKFKAAIAEYAAAGTTTADAHRMQGTDDKVTVLVSTDGCGATWTPLYTFDAASTTTLTNQLTDYTVLLNAYIGQTIQIAFQATDGPVDQTDQDYDFHIGNIIIEVTPACDVPSLAATTAVTKNSATINWAAPGQSSPTGYQYVVSTVNTAPSGAGTPAAGLTANIASLSPLTTYYVFVRSVCGSDFSDWSASGTFTTLCEYPDITGVTGGSVCGQGAVPLSVAAASGQFVWYNAATAGNVVGTGTTFTTPVINATTNYYVSSSTPTPDSNVAIGAGATTSATYSNPFYSAWSNNHTQHLITAQDLYAAGLGAGPINSIALDVTAAGTLPMIDLSIKIGASNAAALTAFTDNSAFATVYTSASYLPTAGVNTFTFTTPFVWDGVSNIVVEFCHGNASSTTTMSRTVKADNTTYASTVKFHTPAATAASVACGATTGTNLTSYTLRPQFIFNGTKLCLSPRQAVTATVTAPPALTLSTAAAAICAGQSATVTVTAGASDYNTYVWSPATGVTGNEVTGWTFSPAATTTYTLTASQTSGAMCAVTKTVAITVNALPGAIGITAPTTPVCLDDIVTLTATGPVTSSTATIGTATTATGTTDEMTAFCNRRVTYKSQTIYTAAEMTAAGLQAGNIVSVAYTINSIGTSANNSNYLVKIGSTTLAAFPSTNYLDESGFTTVYGPVAQTHAVGTNVITFTTPYVWDGTSNIVISVSMGGADGLYNAETLYTDLGANTTLYNYNNMAATTGTYTTRRFNITLATSAAGSVTWTPATNLYTNAAATVPYVAGTGAVSVYAKSAVPVSTQYTATLTNEAGCVSTATATVNAVDCDINWANLQHPANGTINTCGTHAVYAQVYKAGVTEAAGQGANITAWVGVSTSNTDPSTWVEAEWHLATFNVQDGNNDEYMYTISGVPAGTYYYASRFRYLNGDFYYGGYNSGAWDGTTNVNGQLTVNAIAAPTVADATPEFCNSAAVSALQATGSGIKWYDEATGGTALEATVALTNGGTYYASQTVDGCESTARTLVTVTINVIAAPTADATLTVCNAGTVADLQATGTAIKWYDEATGGVALEATVALTNGGTYYASQTVDGCESIARALVTVTVNAPAAPTAAATQTFCDAGTVAGLTATGVAGAAISWYDEATGGVALDGTTALTNGGTYYASQTVTGCESTARTLVTVTISTVSAPVTTVTQPTCTEPTGSIAITSPVGADYTYSVDGTTFQAATSFDGLAPGVYTVTAKNAAGCIATAQATIDIAPVVPDAPVTVVTQPTCNEPTGSIGITSPVGADYTYSVDGTTFQASTSFDGLAPGVYTVTVQNTTGCVSTAQVTIDIAPVVPDAPVTTLTQPTCAVATGTIEVTSPLADAYTYSIDGTTFGPSSIFENVAPGTYTVTVQSPQGCTSTATVVINDAPAVPDAPTGDETQTITAGTAEEATIEDIVVTAAGTVIWYPTAEDAMSGTNAIEAGTQLTNGSTYYGTQTVGECTSAYIAVLVDLVLGKDDFGHNAFSVYPNPVRDILNISYTTEITSVTVHNLLGQQVLAKQPNAAEVKIDLSGLADATYIVNVTAGNTVKTIKVVKKQ